MKTIELQGRLNVLLKGADKLFVTLLKGKFYGILKGSVGHL